MPLNKKPTMPLKKKFHPPEYQKDVVDYLNQELVDAVKTWVNVCEEDHL